MFKTGVLSALSPRKKEKSEFHETELWIIEEIVANHFEADDHVRFQLFLGSK